jgi:hypothetical protein
MTSSPAASTEIRSAPPGRAWNLLLVYGLLIPPLAWAGELYLNFGLASHACFPDGGPRSSFLPGWEGIWTVLVAVNVICALGCAIGLLTSRYSKTRIPRGRPPAEEAGGIPSPSPGRLHAFAVSGLIVSGVFTTAIAFNFLYLLALSPCSQV